MIILTCNQPARSAFLSFAENCATGSPALYVVNGLTVPTVKIAIYGLWTLHL